MMYSGVRALAILSSGNIIYRFITVNRFPVKESTEAINSSKLFDYDNIEIMQLFVH
jgi:hypothetical protein